MNKKDNQLRLFYSYFELQDVFILRNLFLSIFSYIVIYLWVFVLHLAVLACENNNCPPNSRCSPYDPMKGDYKCDCDNGFYKVGDKKCIGMLLQILLPFYVHPPLNSNKNQNNRSDMKR